MYGGSCSLCLFQFQTQLLDDHIKELKRVLKPGHKRLNWNSLGITDYITRCDQVMILQPLINVAVTTESGNLEEQRTIFRVHVELCQHGCGHCCGLMSVQNLHTQYRIIMLHGKIRRVRFRLSANLSHS